MTKIRPFVEAVLALDGKTAQISVPNVNPDALANAIATLKHVQANDYSFDLSSWYKETGLALEHISVPANSNMSAIHRCGTTACAMGWIATSEDWLAKGGRNNVKGNDVEFPDESGQLRWGIEAAMLYLNISHQIASLLFLPDLQETYTWGELSAIEPLPNDQLVALDAIKYQSHTSIIGLLSPYEDVEDVNVQEVITTLEEIRDSQRMTVRIVAELSPWGIVPSDDLADFWKRIDEHDNQQ